ncbi:NAD(P)H-hydrate epimerase [Thermosyntropha lipolytica DSM 11003]|uniref:Bifunctional NAD(P)H-hydrate repair enzyme n=1 Tax=Thermosyntropha lipolytica DSM 11003 TaxID=1123382 RepID=A0A1M5JFG9_9FIRM|nr:NAD(P)H-hydrate epimerase [Thermosyntropha lipolytica DSM 11003]
MKILRAEEMRLIDGMAINEYGIPGIVLMENAGIRTVEVINEILGEIRNKKVVVVAGRGNNGGDGLVIARQLMNGGARVTVFVMGKKEELTPDTRINYEIMQKIKGDIYPLYEPEHMEKFAEEVQKAEIIVDSIYGIGFKGSLQEFEAGVVNIINSRGVPVIAVDIPSGVEADTGKVHSTAVRASHTVTFAAPKWGHILEPGADFTGNLTVADISIPRFLLEQSSLKSNLIREETIKPYWGKRKRESHKGTYGHVLVLGGSLGMTGAVSMAAYAALRAGAGLVTAAVPESLLPIVAGFRPEIMTVPLAETGKAAIAVEALPAIENLLGAVSVCAVGCGMSRYLEAKAIMNFILEKAGVPLVIDADGINALAEDISILKNRQVPVVLTPHPGEMARLLQKSIKEVQADRVEIARSFAVDWNVTLVLKGNKTVVAMPSGDVYVNLTGNPGMATAGSGDVLCGIISGFIAQGLNPQMAAVAGVYVHGRAGDLASMAKGERGLIALDLVEWLPEVLRQMEAC